MVIWVGFVCILFSGLYLFVIHSHTIIAKSSAETYNLSETELAYCEQRALQQDDINAAAKVYWYFRFTKRDFTEADKWKSVIDRLDEKSGATNELKK